MARSLIRVRCGPIVSRAPQELTLRAVSRLVCTAETHMDVELTFDIHSELYPIKEGDTLTLALATTVSLDGKLGDGTYDQSSQPSLLDKYAYAMYGKVFKYDHISDTRVYVGAWPRRPRAASPRPPAGVRAGPFTSLTAVFLCASRAARRI